MTTVYLSAADMIHAETVREIVADAMLYDPNWSGAHIEIAQGDCYTWIDTSDEIAGAALLARITSAVQPAEGAFED